MEKSEKKSERLTFRLTAKHKKEYEDYVNRVGITLTDLIKLAVSEYLEENKLKGHVKEDKDTPEK